MAKSREKVPQLGFWDTEVSTPDHDTVCLWAYDNADSICRIAYPDMFDRPWNDNETSIGLLRHDPSAVDLALKFVEATPRPNPRIIRRTLEYVLQTYTGYQNKIERIVGYADLLIETETPIINPKYIAGPTRHSDDILVLLCQIRFQSFATVI